MVEVLDDGGNAMANAMQSSDIAKDIKRVMLKVLNRISSFLIKKNYSDISCNNKIWFQKIVRLQISSIIYLIKTFSV